MVVRSARIHPTRIPPQNDFDMEPIVTTSSGRDTNAAIGAGVWFWCQTPTSDSSTTVRVLVWEMMSANAFRCPSGIVRPVGLWLSSTKYARFGAVWRMVVSIPVMSQPESRSCVCMGTGTGRAPR